MTSTPNDPGGGEMFDHQQMMTTMAPQRRAALTAKAVRWRVFAGRRAARADRRA